MERVSRMLRLLMLLQSGRGHSAIDLMMELGVSRRTLFRDLRMLQAAGIPCYHEPGKGYRIASAFFLPPINLTVPETLGLMLMAKAWAGRGPRALTAPAVAAVNKLVGSVPQPLRRACSEVMARVSFSGRPQAAGDTEGRWYALLQQCIDQRRECRIVYQSPSEPGVLRCRLRPYVLHFAARAWYVLGWTDVHREVRTLKLARLRDLEATDRAFTAPARFTAASKLGQAWQLKREGRVYEIELEFTPLVATNVREVQWHPSQRVRMLPDGRCVVSFAVDGLDEIAWWICGYADQVRILRPAKLRQRVRAMHARAAAL